MVMIAVMMMMITKVYDDTDDCKDIDDVVACDDDDL